MKNKKGFISLVLLLIFSLSIVTANAGEIETRPTRNIDDQGMTFEERIDLRIADIQAKMDEFLVNRLTNYDERVANGLEYSVKKLEFVEEFAPELFLAYEEAFANHFDVHSILFTTTYTKQEAYELETMTGVEALKISVIEAIEAETMTPQEAAITLREYLVTRREEYKATRDAYKAEIEPLNEVNEANQLIVQELRQELRIAVEASDSERIQNILEELLLWSSVHLDYDYAKLAILDSY